MKSTASEPGHSHWSPVNLQYHGCWQITEKSTENKESIKKNWISDRILPHFSTRISDNWGRQCVFNIQIPQSYSLNREESRYWVKHCGLYSKTLLHTTLTSSKYTHVYDAWISNSLIIHAVKKPITDDHLSQVDESWYITWTSTCNHLSKATTHIEHHNFLSQITLDRASRKQPSLVRHCNYFWGVSLIVFPLFFFL